MTVSLISTSEDGTLSLFRDSQRHYAVVQNRDGEVRGCGGSLCIPQNVVWGSPAPAATPNALYVAAQFAIHDYLLSSDDVLVASQRSMSKQRGYQMPKACQQAAKRGSQWSKDYGIRLSAAAQEMSDTVVSGGSLTLTQIQHIHDYFTAAASAGHTEGFAPGEHGFPNAERVMWDCWGSDVTREWADRIIQRTQSSLIAAAETSAIKKVQEEEDAHARPASRVIIEESAPPQDDEDPLSDYNPDGPHPFIMASSEEQCLICGMSPTTILHALGAATDDSEESEATQAADSAMEDAEAATPEPVIASLVTSSLDCTEEFHSLEKAAGVPATYYFETAENSDDITGIYATVDSGTSWSLWSPASVTWDECGEPVDVLPIDTESAYTVAQLQSDREVTTADIHPSLINDYEWSITDLGLADVVAEVDSAPGDLSDTVFFAETSEDQKLNNLYAKSVDADHWRWNPESMRWDRTNLNEISENTVVIDDEKAEEIALLLSGDQAVASVLFRDGFDQIAVIGAYAVSESSDDSQDSAPESDSDEDVLFDDPQTGESGDAPAAVTADGMYSPQERSKNASQQVRDRMGRFARANARVGWGDKAGVITKVYPDIKAVQIKLDDGTLHELPANQVRVMKSAPPSTGTPPQPQTKKIHEIIKGIPGQPRATKHTPKAMLDKVHALLTPEELQAAVADYEAFVERMRTRKLKEWASFNPDTSDVPPLYFAIVDDMDKTAVLDVVALAPEAATGVAATAYIRAASGWEQSSQMYQRLKSTNPPSVVKLDEKTLPGVLHQVDSFYADKAADEQQAPVTASMWDEYGLLLSVTAAGGLDRNRGNAEELRRYWTKGKGALKIRWGQGGDWTRCVRYLSKYMGPRAKGYCQLRHKEVMGFYTGSHQRKDHKGLSTETEILTVPTSVLSAQNPVATTDQKCLVAVRELSLAESLTLTRARPGDPLRVGDSMVIKDGKRIVHAEVLDPEQFATQSQAEALLTTTRTGYIEVKREDLFDV